MSAFEVLALVTGWIVAVGLGGLWLVILYKIVTGNIDLKYVISEPNGGASLSRFQFLVFTFVIAMSLYLITISQNPPAFPKIPADVLVLLGISGGTYVISKGIQTNRDVSLKREENAKPGAGAVATSKPEDQTTGK